MWDETPRSGTDRLSQTLRNYNDDTGTTIIHAAIIMSTSNIVKNPKRILPAEIQKTDPSLHSRCWCMLQRKVARGSDCS